MSDTAVQERKRKQGWASPGGGHDWLVRVLKFALPVAIGVLMAYLAITPLSKGKEISFILDKNKVDVAKEPMRVSAARYRGQDDIGRPFTVDAASAVQPRSSEPIVDINGVTAQIRLDEGPAMLNATKGRYDLDKEQVSVIGPLLFRAADGYQIQTRDVAVDLNSRTMQSAGRVEGRMRLGRFSADQLAANLPDRKVTLEGRVRLHIVQGGLR